LHEKWNVSTRDEGEEDARGTDFLNGRGTALDVLSQLFLLELENHGEVMYGTCRRRYAAGTFPLVPRSSFLLSLRTSWKRMKAIKVIN
jgi:hypothetical protein